MTTVMVRAKNTPDPFQQDIIDEHMRRFLELERNYFAMFGDVGTGKTFMSIKVNEQVTEILAKRTGKRPTVWCVLPAKLKEKWFQEILKCDTRNFGKLDILNVEGTATERTVQIQLVQYTRPRYVLLSRDQLKEHLLEIMESMDSQVDCLIVDEAHTLGTWTSDITKAARCLRARHISLLTGTPQRNKIDTLYPILAILSPGEFVTDDVPVGNSVRRIPILKSSRVWGTEGEFLGMYAEYDESGRYIVGTRNKPDLNRRMQAFGVWFIDKDEVMDLPELVPYTHTVRLTPASALLYKNVVDGVIKPFLDDMEQQRLIADAEGYLPEASELALLAQLNYARMCCSVPANQLSLHWSASMLQKVINGGEMSRKNAARLSLAVMKSKDALSKMDASDNAKMNWLREFVLKNKDKWINEGGGAFVFTQWHLSRDAAIKAVSKLDYRLGCEVITGDTNDKDVARISKAVEMGKCHLVIGTPASGEGLDLQYLSDVVLVDVGWTPGSVEQAVGRVRRRGFKKAGRLHYLVTENTVETNKMLPTLKKKQKDFDAVKYGERGRKAAQTLDLKNIQDVIGWL